MVPVEQVVVAVVVPDIAKLPEGAVAELVHVFSEKNACAHPVSVSVNLTYKLPMDARRQLLTEKTMTWYGELVQPLPNCFIMM